VTSGVGDLVDLHDPAVGPDQERDALGITRLGRVIDVVRRRGGLLRVAEEPVRVGESLGERAVRLDGIEADPEDDAVLGLEVAGSITEPVALARSTRGIGQRVVPEEDVRPAERGQRHRRAVVGRQLEVGREITYPWAHDSLYQNQNAVTCETVRP
jgi:hypothetical protein